MVALFIDISGKQEYIFQSNTLKINLGASYILAHEIMGTVLIESLNATENDREWNSENITHWRLPENRSSIDRILFIGGGSAYLAFDSKERARAFCQYFTRTVFEKFSGVNVHLTSREHFDPGNFQQEFYNIRLQQEKERSEHLNKNEPFLFGIEQEDTFLGKPVTHFSSLLQLESSEETRTQILAAKASDVAFSNVLLENNSEFALTNEVEEIVTDEDRGYIAVVHVDGNGFGRKFNGCHTLEAFREASINLEENLQKVLKKVVRTLMESMDEEGGIRVNEYQKVHCKKNEEGRWVLPFRPLINAGDDITFVCHGRLGFWLSKLYLKYLQEVGMHACAGIAIVHTKYPFYKAYQLAEDLCMQGKQMSRKIKTPSSWVQFIRSAGGFAGGFENIVQKQYNGAFKNMSYRCTDVPEESSEYWSTDDLDILVMQLSHWNNNKLMKLREALKNDRSLKTFFEIEKIKNASNTIDEKFQDQNALLFDAIEIMNFTVVTP